MGSVALIIGATCDNLTASRLFLSGILAILILIAMEVTGIGKNIQGPH